MEKLMEILRGAHDGIFVQGLWGKSTWGYTVDGVELEPGSMTEHDPTAESCLDGWLIRAAMPLVEGLVQEGEFGRYIAAEDNPTLGQVRVEVARTIMGEERFAERAVYSQLYDPKTEKSMAADEYIELHGLDAHVATTIIPSFNDDEYTIDEDVAEVIKITLARMEDDAKWADFIKECEAKLAAKEECDPFVLKFLDDQKRALAGQ